MHLHFTFKIPQIIDSHTCIIIFIIFAVMYYTVMLIHKKSKHDNSMIMEIQLATLIISRIILASAHTRFLWGQYTTMCVLM